MLNPLDRALFPALNRGAASAALDWLMPRLTSLNKQLWFMAPVVLLCAFVLWKGRRRARVWVLCAVAAVVVSDVLASRVVKPLVPRDRPCHQATVPGPPEARVGPMAYAATRLVGGCPGSRSLPSNHAANMAALAGVCWWFTRSRARWLWFLLPLIIGYSRIYLGYHYPTDVLAGWAFGSLVALAVVRVGQRFLAGDDGPARAPAADA